MRRIVAAIVVAAMVSALLAPSALAEVERDLYADQVPNDAVELPVDGPLGAAAPVERAIPPLRPAFRTGVSHPGIDPEFSEAPPFVGHYSFGQEGIDEPILDADAGRVFVRTRTGVAIVSVDGALIERASYGAADPSRQLIVADTVFLLGPRVIIEMDLETLTEMNRYTATAGSPDFVSMAVLADNLLVSRIGGVLNRVDRATGAQSSEAPIPGGFNPFAMVYHPAWGDYVVIGVGNDIRVYDASQSPLVLASTAADSFVRSVTTGGLAVTGAEGAQDVVLRSVPSLSVTSTTRVSGPLQSSSIAVAEEAGILAYRSHGGDIELYNLGGSQILTLPNPAQLPELLITPDARRVVALDRIANVVWAVSTAPSVTEIDQAVFRPDWYRTLELRGSALGSVTRVEINGQSAPFESVASPTRSILAVDVSRVAGVATAVIMVTGTFGSSSIELDRDPPRGWAAVSIRGETGGAVERDETYTIKCTNLREDFLVRAGQTLTVLAPTHQTCSVEAQGPKNQVRSGFVDVEGRSAFADVWDARISFRTGLPVHLGFVRTVPRTDDVFWLFTFPVGLAPLNVRYPFEITCGEWSDRVVIKSGFGARIAIPPEADDACTAELVKQRGAVDVVSRQIFRSRTRRTADQRMPFRKSKIDKRYMTFLIDHGGADLETPVFVAAPREDIGKRKNAGVVYAFPTGTNGAPRGSGSQMLRQGRGGIPGKAERGDRFGEAIATADFDGDGWLDLAIGVPREDLGGLKNVGLVHIVYGGSNGYRAGRVQTLRQGVSGVPGQAGARDRFGAALAPVDFDGDGWLDLAVGVPGETVGGARGAGMVQIFHGGPDGLSPGHVEELTQATGGYASLPEAGDGFGQALGGYDAMLAVGVPGEDRGSKANVGIVHLVDGLTGEEISDRQGGFTGGRPEKGDRFGEVLDLGQYTLLVGVPREDVGKRKNAGAVHIYEFERTYLRDSPLKFANSRVFTRRRIDGASSQAGDRLGADLKVLEIVGEPTIVVIGSPGDRVGRDDAAGAVLIMELSSGSRRKLLSGWDQAADGVPGSPAPGAEFGAEVAFGPWGSLLVGVPGARVGAQARAGQLLSTQTFDEWSALHQDRRGVKSKAEKGDGFGEAVTG